MAETQWYHLTGPEAELMHEIMFMLAMLPPASSFTPRRCPGGYAWVLA